MSNKKIVLTSIAVVIVATGLFALNPSNMVGNVQAQMYTNAYGYDNNYYQDDNNRYSYDKKDPKNSHLDIQKIKCVNSNININGIDITQIPQDGTTTSNAAGKDIGGVGNTQNLNGLGDRINVERNLVNVCANVNANEQLKVEPLEPATLTVNKEIFGCVTDSAFRMNCQELQDGSSSWLPCIGSSISGTGFCQNLPANLFDIEVLDDQHIILQQFEGSTQGTTIQNLQPGTYTVNELKNSNTFLNQLGQDATTEDHCVNIQGFDDGGKLENTNVSPPFILYNICFEYVDEQGNDCSTLTLASGENKLCTVKNYISDARFGD